jgi:hypothetical protein
VAAASSATPPVATASQAAAPAFPTAAVLQQQAYARLVQLQQAAGIAFIPQLPQGISPVLEATAKNHLNYMFTNQAFTASEDMSLPGSTGKTLFAQAVAAGLPSDENTSGSEVSAIPPGVTGDQWIDALLSTGTGASFLLSGTQFGFAFAPWPTASAPTAMGGMAAAGGLYDDLASATVSNTGLYLYPYNGETNVPPTNLVPDYPGSTAPFFAGAAAGSHGTPISFMVGGADYASITSAVLKDAQGNVVPTTSYGATLDRASLLPNGATAPGWTGTHALVMPTAPLQPDTTYTLTWSAQYGALSVPKGQIAVGYTVSGTLSFTTGHQTPFNPSKLF